ncbi:MAG: type VI secretion system-associated protein [Candidatus Cloacimonetes bacterium 4572_55]|nr:MAG: type VI secretion system-associated protein [Candidatus Cloacimonetes bacterium 4572_55]
MGKSFQHEKPPSRINLTIDVEDGGAIKKVELPLRLLVMGDFGSEKSDVDLEDREPERIDKHNFEGVMADKNLKLDYTVKNRLTGKEGDELRVNLNVDSMSSFRPEEVAKQVPELNAMLAARGLLQDYRDRLVNDKQLTKELEKIVKDDQLRNRMLGELNKMIKDESNT